jgi:proteasome lid subunit RPN8/RPN11
MTVHRVTPLPTGPATGRLLVTDAVVTPTLAALQASSGDHRRKEGLVPWPGRVHLDERAVGATARAARAHGLGVVAQVHSHPGHDTRHSDGDDQLILMPFEGMFSLVVADYGRGSLRPEEGAGLHQHQAGRWVKVGTGALQLIPSLIPVPGL